MTGAQASPLAMPLKNGKRLFALSRSWQAGRLRSSPLGVFIGLNYAQASFN